MRLTNALWKCFIKVDITDQLYTKDVAQAVTMNDVRHHTK